MGKKSVERARPRPRINLIISPWEALGGYVNWLRGDYFTRHLLGKAATSVDTLELNRETEQVGERRRR